MAGYPSPSRCERPLDSPELEVRGGNAERSYDPLPEVGAASEPFASRGIDVGKGGFTSPPPMGISPDVGVLVADESIDGEATPSPRKRACVDGDN